VPLGREIIERSIEQIGQSHDEGETAQAVAECFPTILEAVTRSTLPPPQKPLFAIDACMQDDYDAIGDAADIVFEGEFLPTDGSAVADELARRLQTTRKDQGNDAQRDYRRDCISGWLVDALNRAGRHDEIMAIYERDGRKIRLPLCNTYSAGARRSNSAIRLYRVVLLI